MPTVELFKDDDRVIVDVGSDPEVAWRAKGFSEKCAVKPEVVEITPELEVVQEVIEQPRKPGRPASKT